MWGRRREIHIGTPSNLNPAPEGHRRHSAHGAHQFAGAQKRKADIGRPGPNQRQDVTTLKPFGQRGVEFHLYRSYLSPMSAGGFENKMTARDPNKWLKSHKAVVPQLIEAVVARCIAFPKLPRLGRLNFLRSGCAGVIVESPLA
jgi:hypothetical protein